MNILDEVLGEFTGEVEDGRLSLFAFAGLAVGRGNDQRRAGLIDQHVVGFVNEGEPVGPLEQFGFPRCSLTEQGCAEIDPAFFEFPLHQAVFEEIEPELLGCAVGDILGIGSPSGVKIHLGFNDADSHAKGVEDWFHPLSVSAGEIVIDRREVGAAARKGVEHQR